MKHNRILSLVLLGALFIVPLNAFPSGAAAGIFLHKILEVVDFEDPRPDALLETMLDMALDVVQAERGLILLRDGDGEDADYSVRLARNLEKQTIDDVTEFSRNVVLRAEPPACSNVTASDLPSP